MILLFQVCHFFSELGAGSLGAVVKRLGLADLGRELVEDLLVLHNKITLLLIPMPNVNSKHHN